MLFLPILSMLLCNLFEARASITKFLNPHGNVTMDCTYNVEADKFRWSFQKVDNDMWDIIFDARNHPNPEVKCNAEQKHCKILISDVTLNKAGRYRFEHGINGQPMTTACRYDVVVGELQCQSNIRQSGVIIGENVCPVKPETFTRSCSFSYFGKYNNSINFIWMKRFSAESIFRDKSLKGNTMNSDEGMKLSFVEDSVQVSNDMDKAIFHCRLEGESQIQPCELLQLSVQYLKGDSEKKLKLRSSSQNINCSVVRSQSLECRYHWEVQSGNAKFEIHEQNLTKKHLVMPGSYICHARCEFITGERCQLVGQSFELLPHDDDDHDEQNHCGSKNGYFIGFVILICLNFVLLLLLLGAIFKIRRFKEILWQNLRDEKSNQDLNYSVVPVDLKK